MELRNTIDRKILLERLNKEKFKRVTLSFYRYTLIKNPRKLRDKIYRQWSKLDIFGRIYIAKEGINAQMSVPKKNFQQFKKLLNSEKNFQKMPLKIAVEDNGKSFWKLAIKVKEKIVADGLEKGELDFSQKAEHISGQQFNRLFKNAIPVDMRNKYETDIGKFEKAIIFNKETFRETLADAVKKLQKHRDKKLLLYCTGGIRCEKAAVFLKTKGFKNIYQLSGGIVQYAHEARKNGFASKFKGKNFVFDKRMSEKITDDVLGKCQFCKNPCDETKDCANQSCNGLFIQCENCAQEYRNCCSIQCKNKILLTKT